MTESDLNKTLQEKLKGVVPGLGKVKKLIAVASGKGGVGKSTVAVNLAYALHLMGNKVGLMDADIYGPSSPKMMGKRGERSLGVNGQIIPIEHHDLKMVSMGTLMDGDGPVMWRAPIANRVIQQFLSNVYWGELDYLIIDMPPGTGDIHITLAQQARLNGAVIVTTPQQVAGEVAMKGLKMFSELHVPILGIVENMAAFVCPHCQHETEVFNHGAGERLALESKSKLLARIPLDSEVMMSGDEGVPVLKRSPNSSLAGLYKSLAEKVVASEKEADREISALQPRKLELMEEGESLVANWQEIQGELKAYFLRGQCPCAQCVDENSGQRVLDLSKIPLNIKVSGLRPVGRYGVSLQFSDGHNTGIYRFDYLKKLMSMKSESGDDSFSV